MEYEEALYFMTHNGATSTEEIVSYQMMVKAMEKQIPKNPKWGHHCPNCEIGLAIPEMLMEEYKALCMGCCYPKYCPDCGQRLDWGEDGEYEAYQDEMDGMAEIVNIESEVL